MSVKIRSGALEVLESGVVINGPDDELVFEVDNLKFSFFFRDKEDGDKKFEPSIEMMDMGNNHAKIILNNFNNALGTGTAGPLHVGHIQGRTLHLAFWVRIAGDKPKNKEVIYTFYLGGQANG